MSVLTIAVPTYNRSGDLERLLAHLQREVEPLAGEVEVIVSDNGSTDDTAEVVARAVARWPALMTHRHATNIGAEANFCTMLDRIGTRYFWVLGDDDAPKLGVVVQVLRLLRVEAPGLLYMQSVWRATLDLRASAPAKLRYRVLDRRAFARSVHVWTTFISGMVIDRSALAETDTRRYVGTSLVQLGWVLPALSAYDRFVVVEDECVLATEGNTGGYALLTVFGANFPRVVRDSLGAFPALAETIVDLSLGRYFPGIVWASRAKRKAVFLEEAPWAGIRLAVGRKLRYWLVVWPIGVAPKPIAQLVYWAWRALDRSRVLLTRWSAPLSAHSLKTID